MGLSSSQGRLLMLTSRLSDLQLQEVMVGQRQMELAWESEEAAKVYNEAMSNFKLTIKLPDGSEDGGYKTEDLKYSNMTQLGYLVSGINGEIYLEKDEETGEWIIPEDMNGNKLLEIDPETGEAKIGEERYPIADGSAYLKDPKILQNLIMNGMLFVNNTNTGDVGMTMDLLQADTQIEYVLDTSDDAEAESKYQYEMASIKRKENQLDLELDQLETQHNAVIKEIDSVKEVIKNNVDRTFKLFSNG